MISPVPTTTPSECAARAGTESSTLTGGAEAPASLVSPESVSRQLRWQHKQIKEQNCRQCGEPKVDKNHCAACAEKLRTRARNRYRLRAGIPLEAPLAKNGRPRIAGSKVQVPSSRFEAAEPATFNLSPSTSHQP